MAVSFGTEKNCAAVVSGAETIGEIRTGHPSGCLGRVKEFPHGRSCSGVTGALCYAEAFEHEAENALVLVEGDRSVSRLGKRTDDDSDHVTTTGSEVEIACLIEKDDEEAILLKLRAVDERVDVGLEPGIGSAERTIVRIIARIWDEKRIIGEMGIRDVGGELSEGHQILHLDGIVLHIRKIGERVVADRILSHVVSSVADRRKIFSVRFPCFASREKIANDVVRVDGKGVRREGVGQRERRECLAGGEFQIVGLGGMRVSKIVCREAVFADEAVQVRHRRTGDNVGVVGVFLDDDEDMTEAHVLTGWWRWRRSVGCLSGTTGQGEGAEGQHEQAVTGRGSVRHRGFRVR